MFRISPRPTTPRATRAEAARIIATGSKSFALASRLLPERPRIDASLVYAWCRYVDDAIDTSAPEQRAAALVELRQQLQKIYSQSPLGEPLWAALREVVTRRRIPIEHFETLLDGMRMDVAGTTYDTFEELRLYCHRVAGVVGWLMVSVLGITDPKALRPAAHLGIAMQITNICRDVLEDWDAHRLYLPSDFLTRHGARDLKRSLGGPFPPEQRRAVADTVRELLGVAERFYRNGDEGLAALSPRAATAVRAARLIYSAIGDRVRSVDCDVTRGRAVVPLETKIALLLRASAGTLLELPQRLKAPAQEITFDRVPVYPDDLLPW